LVLFVGEGSRESGMEWSFDTSLQEHVYSPVKAPCLSALWHFEASPVVMTCEAMCPFAGCRAHSALMGEGALAHFVF
jgi:hypothetical protein